VPEEKEHEETENPFNNPSEEQEDINRQYKE